MGEHVNIDGYFRPKGTVPLRSKTRQAGDGNTFSATLRAPAEVIDYIQKEMNRYGRQRGMALRLFFLMMFRMPLGCAEGKKSSFRSGTKYYYLYNGTPFAIEDYSQGYHLRSIMTEDSQSEWLRNMPMKEFKIFGMIFLKK